MSEAKGFLSKHIESAFRKESFESLRQSHELSVDDEVLQDLQGLREHQNLRRLWPRFLYILHTSTLTWVISCSPESSTPSPLQSRIVLSAPALEAISFETAPTFPDDHSPYSEPPSHENNRVWDSLIRPIYFNVTEKELIASGESLEDSVQLVDGGYLASLSVYHDLHCIRRIRLLFYREIYYPNITELEFEVLRHHANHCLEALRVSIMCTGDTTLYTFYWDDPSQDKPATKSNGTRTCINWGKLEKWSERREVPTNANITRPE